MTVVEWGGGEGWGEGGLHLFIQKNDLITCSMVDTLFNGRWEMIVSNAVSSRS